MSFKFKDVKVEKDDYVALWKNSGNYFDKENGAASEVNMVDALSHPNATQFFPITVNNLVRETSEPLSLMNSLLERVSYTPGMQVGGFSVGAVDAGDVDEGQEYPEVNVPFAGGSRQIVIGKSGIALKFTDEMKRYSQYDLVALLIKKMGQALVRHKEKKGFAMFSKMGVPTHNNINPSQSVFGTTTGYGYGGSANGSITPDDIMNAYTQLLMNGYYADTLVVHPLAYTMFLSDPIMRQIAINGGGGAYFNGWNGNALNAYPFSKPNGKMGPGGQVYGVGQNPDPKTYNGSASPKIPSYLGIPLRTIVSPFVPYNSTTKMTDIYLVDSRNIGALVVDEDPTMEEVQDRLRDMTKIKIRERYTPVPYNDGGAIAIMKNVKVTPSKMASQGVAIPGSLTLMNTGAAVLDASGNVVTNP